jgi:hypothetical protein
MMRITKRSFVYAVLIAFAAPCADVSAQFPGGGGMGMGGGGGMGGGMRGSRGGREAKPNAVPVVRRHLPDEIDERLYTLEQDLRLTPEQQPLWTRYADAVRLTVQDIERDRTRSESTERVPVPEGLDRTVEASRNRLTALEDVAGSAKALYQVLVPPQRAICDPRLATITALLVEPAPQPGTAAQPWRR